MSEFNELVKAYLLGNNIYFEESDKEKNTLLVSVISRKKGFTPKLFESLKTQKESLKIFMLDDPNENDIYLNNDADIIIWNDSFSGNALKNRINKKINKKAGQESKMSNGELDGRYLGMGKDILFSKFYGNSRMTDILEVGKLPLASGYDDKSFFTPDTLGVKRFNFILEETHQEQYLKQEYNRFMEFYCKEEGIMGQSLPLFFNSIDFWFGGMLHSQLTNRLNQDLGLFVTEDTVFYMVRLGYIIPFITEMDLFCKKTYLDPQAEEIAHLFYLCGERGMFVAGCTWDSVLFEDFKNVDVKENRNIISTKEWLRIIAKPMGSRLLEDEDNAELFGIESGIQKQLNSDEIIKKSEQMLIDWINDPEFPILIPADRKILMKQVASKWLEKGAFYLELEDFHNILFTKDILREGKRTLAHVHEIVRAVMSSGVMIQSDYSHIIPVSRLMGEAVVLWMLTDDYGDTDISLEKWLDRKGLNQRVLGKLLKRFSEKKEINILTPLANNILNLINNDQLQSPQELSNENIVKNAFEIHISINNRGYSEGIRPVTGSNLYDMNMSHKMIINLVFEHADLHNIQLQQTVFVGCRFYKCNLTSSYNAGSTFLNCHFEKSIFKNADFSGSLFRGCTFFDNVYDNSILIGCAFEDGSIGLDTSPGGKHEGIKLWTDGSSGFSRKKQEKDYDLPILIYLLQRQEKFFSRYGFRINPDVGFHYLNNSWGAIRDEGFLEQYSYYDLYDYKLKKPELFFSKTGVIHHVKNGKPYEYPYSKSERLTIDHVVKYSEINDDGSEKWITKILYHTPTATLVEDNPNPKLWLRNSEIISDKFIGRGVSGTFVNHNMILMATDLGGLFLFQYKGGNWITIDSKFQSEPASHIFPDCFENMAFVKRGATVIEIWDTLNDLSLIGRLVTSFKEIIGIRLIESLNHAIVYGEWADNSIGALVYNIINTHLITYWSILSQKEAEILINKRNKIVEELYNSNVRKILITLNEQSSRQVSLKAGYIKEGCKELQQIMDSLKIIHPKELTYMENEQVEFLWMVRNHPVGENTGLKTYIDIDTGENVDFDFEIKIGDVLSVPSGKLIVERKPDLITVLWKQDRIEKQKNNIWGDHSISFSISLMGEIKQEARPFKIRPANPFKGGVSLSKEMGSDYLFVGRREELKKSLKLIDNGDSFTIKGARRIGKTSFINRLRENLPEDVLTAYISFDEFEKNTTMSYALSKIQKGVSDLSERYPDIYDEFKEDFSPLRTALNTLDFQWLMTRGLEKLKDSYPAIVDGIWPQLEKYQKAGKDASFIFQKFSKYLNKFDNPPKIVFLIDEIGIAGTKDAALNDLFNPFRPLIESKGVIVILAGIPYNFHELTSELDIQTDSGFMSYVNSHIILGPLSDEECKWLIRNNLSKRIKISEDVLDHALNLSTRRPEDLQIIMHHALESIEKNAEALKSNTMSIESNQIEYGFDRLLEIRGYTCSKIWEKISCNGKEYLEIKLKTNVINPSKSLNLTFNQLNSIEIPKEDIEVFKGYGFSTPDETRLVLPMYFQEWVRREFYKRKFKKEENKYEG